jgi:hypothetical protein
VTVVTRGRGTGGRAAAQYVLEQRLSIRLIDDSPAANRSALTRPSHITHLVFFEAATSSRGLEKRGGPKAASRG